MTRAWLGLAVALVLPVAAAWLLVPRTVPEPPPPPPARAELTAVTFADLPGWAADRHGAAVPAFLESCRYYARLPDERSIGPSGLGGRARDWTDVCAAAGDLDPADDAAARAFFEGRFVPLAVRLGAETTGLFTGYYEAALTGRRAYFEGATPLLRRPDDLVMVDLGQFRDSMKGERIAGRVVDGRLRPFPDRAAIEDGALAERGLELVWVDDPVDAFFLHIQGSGRINLDDGGVMRVGYAAQNGHPYTAIGRVLIAEGALTRETVSMQSIRAWLDANPARAAEVMNANASYVFFHELTGPGPLGAINVPLTPERSLAVDRTQIPMGAPLWLDTEKPAATDGGAATPFRQLMVAQDTGGAIRGAIRGDVFWGHGAAAAAVAGRMKSRGQYYLLLPKRIGSSG